LEERLHTTPDVSFVTWPRVFLFFKIKETVSLNIPHKSRSATQGCVYPGIQLSYGSSAKQSANLRHHEQLIATRCFMLWTNSHSSHKRKKSRKTEERNAWI